MPSGNLSRAGQNFLARRRNYPEVPPSASLQTGGPLPKRLVVARITTVPCIKGGGTKVRFHDTLNVRIGKNDAPGLLTSPSATPFHKIGKHGFPRCRSGLQCGIVVTVSLVRCQIAVVNRAQFYGLIGGGWQWSTQRCWHYHSIVPRWRIHGFEPLLLATQHVAKVHTWLSYDGEWARATW